jgi:hypothetical protein
LQFLVPFYHILLPSIYGTKILWHLSPREGISEAGSRENKNEYVTKSVYCKSYTEARRELTGYHFSIIGHAEAETEFDLKTWLEGIMQEHLDPGNPSIEAFTVLTKEDADV